MSAILAIAILLWGTWFVPPPITVVDESTNPAYANVYNPAWAAEWPDGSCTISVGQTWSLLTLSAKVSTMAHEVGHCAGLQHDCSYLSLMCESQLSAPTYEDHSRLWEAQSVQVYRLVVGWCYDC